MKKNQKKKLQKAIISFVIAIIAIYFGIDDGWDESSNTDSVNDQYKVQRVVDGDTLIIEINDTEERVRLIGVDTPESVHPDKEKNVPYGEIASAYTKSMVEGKWVDVELDVQERDRYGRVLAYVYIEGEMLNELLLTQGHAKIATYPPNVKYLDLFKKREQEARKQAIGIWAYE